MARGEKNPWIGVNYLDTNPVMAVPPPFWLQRLYDYDAELVVMPSKHVPYAYVLARRQRMVIPSQNKVLIDSIDQPDTKTCLAYGLVPVTMIYRYSQGSWSIDNIIASLQSRDIWRHGGGEKVADMIDKQENDERAAKMKAVRDDMWMRSGAAYESYKRRTGQRTSVPGRATVAPASKKAASGRTGSKGSVVLTDAV